MINHNITYSEWLSKQPWKTRYKILGFRRGFMWSFKKKEKKKPTFAKCMDCKEVYAIDDSVSIVTRVCNQCIGKKEEEHPKATTCVCGRPIFFATTRLVSQKSNEYKGFKTVQNILDLEIGSYIAHKDDIYSNPYGWLIRENYKPNRKLMIVEVYGNEKHAAATAVECLVLSGMDHADRGSIVKIKGIEYRVFMPFHDSRALLVQTIKITDPNEWVIV